MNETYYAFMFGDEKAGYQVVRESDDGGKKNEILTKFMMDDQMIDVSHTLMFAEDGTLAGFSADDSETFNISDYADADNPYPTAATQEIIDQMPLEVGGKFTFTAISDGTGETLGEKSFVVTEQMTWKNPITEQEVQVVKIIEMTGEEEGRYFLVDSDRITHLAFWCGPQSVRVSSRDQAVEGLDFE